VVAILITIMGRELRVPEGADWLSGPHQKNTILVTNA
jgi:hypothetical protein